MLKRSARRGKGTNCDRLVDYPTFWHIVRCMQLRVDEYIDVYISLRSCACMYEDFMGLAVMRMRSVSTIGL